MNKAPGYKLNYFEKDEHTPVFSFPTDTETRKWFLAIPRPREHYDTNKRLKVCWIRNFDHYYNLENIFIIKSNLCLFVYVCVYVCVCVWVLGE